MCKKTECLAILLAGVQQNIRTVEEELRTHRDPRLRGDEPFSHGFIDRKRGELRAYKEQEKQIETLIGQPAPRAVAVNCLVHLQVEGTDKWYGIFMHATDFSVIDVEGTPIEMIGPNHPLYARLAGKGPKKTVKLPMGGKTLTPAIIDEIL